MGKLPAEGGGKGLGCRHGSRLGSRLGSRVFPTRGGIGLGSAASLSTSDEKTRRMSRQHISKGGNLAPATPSLSEGKPPFHAVKGLFKPYQVGTYPRPPSDRCLEQLWEEMGDDALDVAFTMRRYTCGSDLVLMINTCRLI